MDEAGHRSHGRKAVRAGDARDGRNDRVGGRDRTFAEILAAWPYLEDEDIRQALAHAAWRVEEIEVPLSAA